MSLFDAAIARADVYGQLRVFGDVVTFHDPAGDVEDSDITVIFAERDIPEPPNSMGVVKGQYSTAWSRLSLFPVNNPEGYQLIADGVYYFIRAATVDGVGAVSMKLHRDKSVVSTEKLIDDVLVMDNVTEFDTLQETT